jgi:hypothetical protein
MRELRQYWFLLRNWHCRQSQLLHIPAAGECWLAPNEHGQIKRCQYVEQCVAPLAKKRAQAASSQEQQHAAANLADGVRAYEAAVMPALTIKYAKV